MYVIKYVISIYIVFSIYIDRYIGKYYDKWLMNIFWLLFCICGLLKIILMDVWGSGGFIGNGDKVRVVNIR